MTSVNVLFVCLGNICRSPTAHGVFEQQVREKNLQDRIAIDSAGTGDWHIDHPPDPRTIKAAAERGYDLSCLRARQVTVDDFRRFNYVLAMDRTNLADLQRLAPADFDGELKLLLDYLPDHAGGREVPDPYYGGRDGFTEVFTLVETACSALLAHLIHRHQL